MDQPVICDRCNKEFTIQLMSCGAPLVHCPFCGCMSHRLPDFKVHSVKFNLMGVLVALPNWHSGDAVEYGGVRYYSKEITEKGVRMVGMSGNMINAFSGGTSGEQVHTKENEAWVYSKGDTNVFYCS